jgi:hypothetical protein
MAGSRNTLVALLIWVVAVVVLMAALHPQGKLLPFIICLAYILLTAYAWKTS